MQVSSQSVHALHKLRGVGKRKAALPVPVSNINHRRWFAKASGTVSLISSLIVLTTWSLVVFIIIVTERYDFRLSVYRQSLKVHV